MSSQFADPYLRVRLTSTGHRLVLAGSAILILAGIRAFWHMEIEGHWVTGMSNRIVWGLPHVFAIWLILAASGALNAASLAGPLNFSACKPWTRLSAVVAVSLLIGGLAILVLDLGRPDRLIVAMTHYNFQSVFAWNIFLYCGLLLIVAGYLICQFEYDKETWLRWFGWSALLWRIILTCGTGGIFAFLVARPLYGTAMLMPLFLMMSLVLGNAAFLLCACLLDKDRGEVKKNAALHHLSQLQVGFIVMLLLFLALFHLTGLYSEKHNAASVFVLAEGGIYTALFWIGQVFIGGMIPIAVHLGWTGIRMPVVTGALAAVTGGFCGLYVMIIGGQAFPMELFPGKVIHESHIDGTVASYSPAVYELLLGLGGVSLSLVIILIAARLLPLLPATENS